MNECILNAKEIMCIAANLGATELYGIPDGFGGIPKAALSKEVIKVQASLEAKGYLTEDFDGNSELDGRILELIAVCAYCEKFIAIDRQVKKHNQEGILFYVKGTKVVRAEKAGENYKLTDFDASFLNAEIKNMLQWEKSSDTDKVDCTVTTKVLEKAKTLKKRKANDAGKKELINAGMDKVSAEVILNGLNDEETFYSFTFVDLTAETDNVKNLMYINSEVKSLKLQSVMVDEKDMVLFSNIDYDTAVNELTELVKDLRISGEVFA